MPQLPIAIGFEMLAKGLIDVFEEFSILVKDYNLLSKLSGDTLLMSGL